MWHVPSPINWLADRIRRLSQERQLMLIDAYTCVYVAVFVTMITIGIGIEFEALLF